MYAPSIEDRWNRAETPIRMDGRASFVWDVDVGAFAEGTCRIGYEGESFAISTVGVRSFICSFTRLIQSCFFT